MSAFLFTLMIFAYWGLVGLATITLFPPRLRVMQGLLVSPAIGVAVTILPVFLLNRLGIPVKDFGQILLSLLALISALVIYIKRPLFPVRRCLPFCAIFLAALLLAAWPMFSYSFDWISFANDDMANYCLAAQRFLNYGYFDFFNSVEFYEGKDYSQSYWFMHVKCGIRAGSELMLSAIWSFSGLNAHQIFMPVIMALHLALIGGSGAMVSGRGMDKKVPMITTALMALSPMTTLGALYQLIGQVGGLTLLTAAVTLMYRPQSLRGMSKLLQCCISAALVFSALFIWYPELLPFFGLGWLLYVLFLLIQRKECLTVVVPALWIGVLTLIILNQYIVSSLMFMLKQAFSHRYMGHQYEFSDMNIVMFPYFLIPSGLANLWGLIPIADTINEPYLSIAILGGLMIIYWLALRVIPPQMKKMPPPFLILLPMLVTGFFLFCGQSDFGLYKLSMFVQPFLLSVVAAELATWKTETDRNFIATVLSCAPLLVFVPIGMTQQNYVSKSTGEFNSGFSEICKASSQKINRQFKQFISNLVDSHGPDIRIIAETNNVVFAKLQVLYTKNAAIFFPVRDFFDTNINPLRSEHFEMLCLGANSFEARKENLADGNSVYIYSLMMSDIFNSQQRTKFQNDDLFIMNKSPKNRLLFIHSTLGSHYYSSNRRKVAFYQLENDPMIPGQFFSSLGRHLFFQAINPSENSRIVMEITDTVLKQFNCELPQPQVQNATLHFVGRGSGRIFSDTIEPTFLNGKPYISIDMKRNGLPFAFKPKWMMLLYGRHISPDPRLITAFGRDISLISEEDYLALKPPVSLQTFPDDLTNKNLEYSGIYEDGWISEESFFVLSINPDSRYLVIKGMVPLITNPRYTSTIKVRLDGKEVAEQIIGLDKFELKVPVSSFQGHQRIDIAFSDYQHLPGEDGRIIGAKIDFIGFTNS